MLATRPPCQGGRGRANVYTREVSPHDNMWVSFILLDDEDAFLFLGGEPHDVRFDGLAGV